MTTRKKAKKTVDKYVSKWYINNRTFSVKKSKSNFVNIKKSKKNVDN